MLRSSTRVDTSKRSHRLETRGRRTTFAALLAAVATLANVVGVAGAGPAATITPGPGLSPILGNGIFPVRQNSFILPGTTGPAGTWSGSETRCT